MAVENLRLKAGAVAGGVLLAVTPIGWVTGGIAASLAIIGGIGDAIFGGETKLKEITLSTDFGGEAKSWVPMVEPWNKYMRDGGANGRAQGEHWYAFDHLKYYQGHWKTFVSKPEVVKGLGILPTKWKNLISDGLSNNAHEIKYEELLETVIASKTMEEIEALSTEELAALVEEQMIVLYPKAITLAAMDSFLLNYPMAKNIIFDYSKGWFSAGKDLASLKGTLKGARNSILASESSWESMRGVSNERDTYNDCVTKLNNYSKKGGVVPLVTEGLVLTRKMTEKIDKFYSFILRERRTRGSMALRAFDSSRVSAISEKYVKVIEGINAKHLTDMAAQATIWQDKFDAQAKVHAKEMKDMKDEYDKIIVDLKNTIEEYKTALNTSLGLLDKFKDRLDAADGDELSNLRSGQTNLRNTSDAAFSRADELRNRPYSPGAAAAELASQAALTAQTAKLAAEEKAKRDNLPFYKKYPKELAIGAGVGALAIYIHHTKKDGPANNTNTMIGSQGVIDG